MRALFETVAETLRAEQSVALVTVIRSIGSTPRHAAAKMAVQADGSFVGTIGGGTMEHTVIRDAQAALEAGERRLVSYSLIGKEPGSMGLCGGTQEIFIDVLSPQAGDPESVGTLQLFEAVVASCRAGEPAALVTLVYSADSGAQSPEHSPEPIEGLVEGSQIGRKLLVRFDSSTVGRLGGELEGSVVSEARKALHKNHSVRLGYRPRRKKLAPLGSFKRQPLEFFVDVVQPRSELVIIGAGHIGLALAEMAKTMDMRVVVVDDRSEWLDRFPDADEAILVPYEPENEQLGQIPVTFTPSTHVVVATWGWDEPAMEQVVGSPAPYIGLVASRRKAKIIFDELLDRGISQEELARVHVPAGLDIGAETPPEIALSILSEMLLLRRDATGLPMQEVKGHPLVLSTNRR